ncbi:MAG: transposase, partial [Coprobacillus sp.]
CTKSKTGRTINYCEELDKFHEEVKKNVQSEEGIQLMFQRSNETEGTFGDLKANQKYDRLHRRGETGVRLEIYLVCIGHNLRKYHRLKIKAEKQIKEMLNLFN